MHAKCQIIGKACELFYRMPQRNVVSLTCTIDQQSSSLLWAPIPYVTTDVEAKVEKTSESMLNKVSNLNLVNIVYLRAMDWAILQCPIRGSITSSLTITCTSLGGNRLLTSSSSLALSSSHVFLRYSSTSIPRFKRFGNASICCKK